MPEQEFINQKLNMTDLSARLTDNFSALDESKIILFNTSKKEFFTPTSGFKVLQSRLKVHWTIKTQKDELSLDRLKNVILLILGLPRDKFSLAEFNAIRSYLESGGNVLVLMGEGGEQKANTNINFLLEEFGILVNSDCVVRTVFHKYFHPKEALIVNGVINRGFKVACSGNTDSRDDSLPFLYPHGSTLTVQKPAIAVLSSGSTSYPLNRPICALCTANTGKLAVIGSADIFSDSYIHKEDNEKVFNALLQWLTTFDGVQLNQIDAENPEVSDFHFLPDMIKSGERVRTCVQENDEVSLEHSSIFTPQQFGLYSVYLSNVMKAYDELHVKREVLSLIKPKFELPMPPLQPAVFAPPFHELPFPALDLFDLDDHFSSEKTRLAQLTNKCSDDEDLEFYVRECGQVLGVNKQLKEGKVNAKNILEHVFSRIVEYKKANPELKGVENTD